jgi:hypothetical protein
MPILHPDQEGSPERFLVPCREAAMQPLATGHFTARNRGALLQCIVDPEDSEIFRCGRTRDEWD